MAIGGYMGISFPFRVGNRGGVVTSTTSKYSAEHIIESVVQILSTRYTDRVMEPEIFSEIDTSIFEPNDELTQDILIDQIVTALEELEERITVTAEDIELHTEEKDGISVLFADITFMVDDYETYYEAKNVAIGEV